MRVTTNSMVRNYNSSLTSSLSGLNRSREMVYTQRKFTRAYQDPAGALRASELQRNADKIDSHLSTLTTAQSRQDSADSILQQIVSLTGSTANDEALKAVSEASPDARKTYATTLRELQKSLLQLSNSKFGENYLLAGADGKNAPFSMDANGKITYRGIDVNDEAALRNIADEKLYMDLGMGLQVDTTNGVAGSSDDINGASAYNTAISGLKAFGFGETTGNPPISKNAMTLLGEMADALDPDISGSLDKERFHKLRDQFSKTHSTMADYNAEVGVRGKFLENTKERLEDEQLNLSVQLDAIVTAQPAEAITDYSYSQYVYNLVLKVGTSLLTNSFIDFMK